MNNFITNTENKDLKTRLTTLISASVELKFLVGFFYFSGVEELYDSLTKNNDFTLKMLVGMDIDFINGKIVEISLDRSQLSNREISKIYLQDVLKTLNTDEFDSKSFVEQIDTFLQFILENRIIIRKTLKPNHAKLYLFKLNETQIGRRNLFITGSSNLTRAGILSQDEFNVEISDYGFDDAEKYFDELWENAIQITEDERLKKEIIKLVLENTHIKEITPFEAYCFVLKSYLDTYENENQKKIPVEIILEKSGYKPFNYQVDAVKQAISIIEKHNGVIIADVVGLGKTVIACAIGRVLKKRGLVISPPGLIGDENKKAGWKKYLEEFQLYDWEVRSLGKLEETLNFIKERDDIEIVVVDEAHRFRNEDTKDYEILHHICRDRKVILLSATPFNNKPSDIFSLLKLFITPKKSTITIENNLDYLFRKYEQYFKDLSYIKRYYKHPDQTKQKIAENKYVKIYKRLPIKIELVNNDIRGISKKIKHLLEPVLIRRNRLDLKKHSKYKDEIKRLSEVKDPIEWYFELDDTQDIFYDKILKYFDNLETGGKFKGAIYRPYEYEAGINIYNEDVEKFIEFQQQRNLFDFMRRLIVRRFESSFGAFKKTIENFKKTHEIVLDFVQKTGKYILDRDLIEKIYELDLDEIEIHLEKYKQTILQGNYPKKHKVYNVNEFKNKDFLKDISEDISLFDEILTDIDLLKLLENDPKVAALIQNIKQNSEMDIKRKVIVFSEFIDTVEYLKPHLQKAFDNRVLVVKDDLTGKIIEKIYTNFDATYKIQKNEYDILLCTDKISEGFNLNRAGMVINYDIPWNPVRVIQRLGRINRIGKKVFDELYIVNFFPTKKGTNIVQAREIASNKMFMIHNILGEDAKIFEESEEISPSNLYNRIMTNPESLEEESFYTRIYNEFKQIRGKYPDIVDRLNDFPNRIKVAKEFDKDELIVFMKKNSLYALHCDYNTDKIAPVDLEDVLSNIKVEKEKPKIALSDIFWDKYNAIREFREKNTIGTSQKSIEKRAFDMINFLLKNDVYSELKSFLSNLKIDMLEYGTLSDYTLRRIANLQTADDKFIKEELTNLKAEIGEDFIERLKNRTLNTKKEIIIAIENRRLTG